MSFLFIVVIVIIIIIKVKNTRQEEKRKSTKCKFEDGISEQEFTEIVKFVGSNITRLKNISADGTIVSGTVKTQSGISEWDFTIDFNDYGHITGNYWLSSENYDSKIPKKVAERIKDIIEKYPDSLEELNLYSAKHESFCPYCGASISFTDALFCSSCGKRIK